MIGVGLSLFFDRPRPADHLDVLMLSGPSFPSVRALMAVLCYGLLAYLLVPQLSSLIWKGAVVPGILLLVLFEGLSRIFHGNHYLTDVLAGYLLGMAWLVLVCLLMENFFMSRGETNE